MKCEGLRCPGTAGLSSQSCSQSETSARRSCIHLWPSIETLPLSHSRSLPKSIQMELRGVSRFRGTCPEKRAFLRKLSIHSSPAAFRAATWRQFTGWASKCCFHASQSPRTCAHTRKKKKKTGSHAIASRNCNENSLMSHKGHSVSIVIHKNPKEGK